jgi:copper chaperone CopZ
MSVVKVKGMSCQHCVKSVTEVMEALGAKDVSIDLLSGDVTYNEDAPISKDAIKEAVTKIGFEFVA